MDNFFQTQSAHVEPWPIITITNANHANQTVSHAHHLPVLYVWMGTTPNKKNVFLVMIIAQHAQPLLV